MGTNFTVSEVCNNETVAKIRVVGVGGGGGNMINHIIREGIAEKSGLKKNDLIVANTDMQALDVSEASNRIQIGKKRTRGLGAGMKPQVGEESAIESYDEIKAQLDGSNIVFIATGLGGGTGTGAAPVVAKVAKEIGALTVAVVTLPFELEGKMRMKLALTGLASLKETCDSVIVVPNQRLIGIIDKKMSYRESFKIVDDILSRAVSGMCSIVLKSSSQGINIDFADLETAMTYKGESLIGVGEADGENAAQVAVTNATQSPLLENINIKGAKGLMVHFTMHPDLPMYDIEQAMQYVNELVGEEEVYTFFGTATDESLTGGRVIVTLIATGVSGKDTHRLDSKPETVVSPAAKQQPEYSQHVQHVAPSSKPEAKKNDFLSSYRKVSGGYTINEDDDLDAPVISRYRLD